MKIGVFDSGIGGKSIALTLERDFPNATVMYVDDHEHVPYGSRETTEIIRLTDVAIQPLLLAACDVIVLACNTATAAAIEILRSKYPATPFIGLEPMVKPAVELSESGIIAVCATPSTLKSERYGSLKNQFAENTTIIEPDCSDWASMIEHEQVEDRKITDTINRLCEQGTDVIVLACTHYHWIKDRIVETAQGRAAVLDPSDAISNRVREVLYEAR